MDFSHCAVTRALILRNVGCNDLGNNCTRNEDDLPISWMLPIKASSFMCKNVFSHGLQKQRQAGYDYKEYKWQII